MENQKSLQQSGSQQVKNNMQYLLAELQDKIQNQNIDVMQSVSDLLSEGNNPQEVAMALMQIGYDENVIKQIFQNLESNQQPEEEEEIKEVATQKQTSSEHPESLQERVQQLQQEGMTAKKGKEKYNKGGHFKNWMNRNYGYISDNDKYDVPSRFQSLPTEINRTSGLDFVTDMFKVGKRAVGTVKDAIARKNDLSYNKYSVKFGKDANLDDFYITDQSLYEASKNKGDLMTKDQAARMMKDKSRFIYNPDTKAYSYALARNPFASESEIQNQINKEMGKKYRDKYKEMSLPDYERTMNLFKSFIPKFSPRNKTTTASTSNSNTSNSTEPIKGESQDDYNRRVNGTETYSANTYIWDGSNWVSKKQLGGGTHNTHYAQVGGDYPGTINQTEFPGFTFGDTPDYATSEDDKPLSFRNWFAQNYGSNLNFSNQNQSDLTQQYSSYLQDFDPYTYVSEGAKEKPKDKPGSILDPLRDIETNYTDEEVDAYMNLSEDLAASNFVNKGSMGKQPSVEAQQQLQDAMPKDTSAKVKIKNKGAFSKAFDTVTDVAGLAVDAGRSINKLLEDSENLKRYNDVAYSTADQKFGTDIGSKGYYTYQQEGILQPNMQTEYITQKGREMNSNRYRNLMMQYGGLPKAQYENSQVKSDNTRVNQMSEADIQAYINMMNTARDEETFFKHFPYAKNMKVMPVRDPSLQDRDTNVVIKDGMAYYPKYPTGYMQGEEGSGDNRGFVKDYLDPKWKGKRSMIPYFEVGSDPNSVSLMRKFQNSNLPFDFGNAFPRGYMDVEEYLQNISPVGRKMQMGGMNPMSDFFMDNDLPIYQSQGEIPNAATLKEMYKMFGETGNNLINVDNVSGLDAKRKVAAVNRAIIESRGSVSTPETFVEDRMGRPNSRVEYIYTQDSKIPDALETPMQIPDQKLQEYYAKIMQQERQMQNKPGITSGQGLSPEMKAALNRGYGERTNKKYGGSSNPFSKKRQLRKKRGGQIANISTDVLKRLQEEANKDKNFKFDVL